MAYDHYIPQFHLKKFRARRSKKLWVYDREENCWLEDTPKKILRLPNFYTQSENSFYSFLEDHVAKFGYHKLITSRSVTDLEERMIMAWYLWTLESRSPTFRKRYRLNLLESSS